MFKCDDDLLFSGHRETFSAAGKTKNSMTNLMQQDAAPVTAFLQVNGFVVIVPSPVKLFAIVFKVWDDSHLDLMA